MIPEIRGRKGVESGCLDGDDEKANFEMIFSSGGKKSFFFFIIFMPGTGTHRENISRTGAVGQPTCQPIFLPNTHRA